MFPVSTISSLVSDRFELLEEMPRVTDGQIFRARDLVFGETVAVKLLGAGCSMESPARQALEIAVRRAQSVRHPHLLRHDSLDSAAGVHVREWIHGFSLLDLLRRRRELTAEDTFHLLATLPAALDHLATHGLPVPRPLLGKIFVQFDEAASPEALVARPLWDWPPFAVKVDALTLRALVSDATRDTTRTLIAGPPAAASAAEASGPRIFAELLYELLGGRQRDMEGRRYSPISALNEAGNGVLRRALLVAPHADCQSLWKDLRAAQSSGAAPPVPLGAGHPRPRTPVIPAKLLGQPHPGLALILTPEDPGSPAIHLSAHPQFKIGRSLRSADFVTRFFPESAANLALTDRLSRVHVVAENVGGRLFLRDGNGSSPSLNGSLLDAHRLSPDHPTPLQERAILALGEEYFLEVIPLLHPTPRALPDAWPGMAFPPARPRGALVCAPRNGQPELRRSVWIFSEIGFGLDSRGRLVWDTRAGGESPAALHYHRGCFWLRNHALGESALALDKVPLNRDQIAPITHGQSVVIGFANFTAEIH